MQKFHLSTFVKCIFVAITTTTCASVSPSAPIRHGFELKIDRSAGKITKLQYHYSDFSNLINSTEFPWRTIKISDMPIPEYFEVSWLSLDGIEHQEKIPVRGHLPISVKNNDVQFVIMKDSVQGYVSRFTSDGEVKTRFY